MKHVIHSDSSEFFRKLMKTFFSEVGLECESFERGNEVVDAVSKGRASFVITGLELADMSGEELIKRLIVLPGKIPIIIVTSNEEAKRSKTLEALGVKAIIMKSGDWKGELSNLLGLKA